MSNQIHVPKNISTLGEAIRFLRTERKLTLRALAEKAGISAPFLSDIEHDRRKTDKIEEIAEVLGVPIEELQALDGRLPGELKDWLAANPPLVALLKELQRSGRPVPVEVLRNSIFRRR
jgi:transcriptional regulator with XRE-family HTH domain